MCSADEVGPDRRHFNFADLVMNRYKGLAAFGLVVSEALPTIVRYRRDDLELRVYHGRQSYEVGLQIGHGDELFSISELIRSADPAAAESYRNPMATTPTALASALDQLTELLGRYGDRALRDDSQFFAALRQQRQSRNESYELDVLARQVRPIADAAFREGRYREAGELYERMASRLTPVEQRKLEVARKRV